jgi:hypothetical protein
VALCEQKARGAGQIGDGGAGVGTLWSQGGNKKPLVPVGDRGERVGR